MSRSIPQFQRRVAVLLQLSCFPLTVLAGYWLALPVSFTVLFGFSLWLLISLFLFWNTGLWRYGNAPDEHLDERQLQLRNHAYRLAYIGISTLLFYVLFYQVLGADFGWPPLNLYPIGTVLFWEGFLLILTLPSIILAWIEGDYQAD